MTAQLSDPIALPGGAVLSNRLGKAAMSEGLSDAHNNPTPRLETLYRRWARAGAGLLLSGNFQVDRQHLERPTNVVVDEHSDFAALARLAAAGKAPGVQFWAQLSHTGRQVDRAINPAPLAPSAVEIEVVRGAGYDFAPPRAMSGADIEHAIAQFAFAAGKARELGFDGVALHAAHGYLISQFLSLRSNQRSDAWGGSLKNRARFLLETIKAVRGAVGPGFPIGIKLNASDFLKGGFTNAECIELVSWLNESSLDLLELSGGSLEQPKIVGVAIRDQGEDVVPESARRREAYFVAFAGAVKKIAAMPVMVTGGFRSLAAMTEALQDGELDIVGLGRPMIAAPDTPKQMLSGEIDQAPAPEIGLFHIIAWHSLQIERIADGLEPDLSLTGDAAREAFARIETENFAKVIAARQR